MTSRSRRQTRRLRFTGYDPIEHNKAVARIRFRNQVAQKFRVPRRLLAPRVEVRYTPTFAIFDEVYLSGRDESFAHVKVREEREW